MSRRIVSQTHKRLNQWKYEVARDMHIPLTRDRIRSNSNKHGSIGGNTKNLVRDYTEKYM